MTNRLKKAWQALIGREVKNYTAADMTRLTYDWPTQITSPTQVLRYSLTTMRARSRHLVINNDYARRFIWMVGVNVIGPGGIALQCKAKWPDGKLDKWANDRVEEGWHKWGEKGSFDVTGTLSMTEADRLGVQAVAGDGEIIVRIVENFDNDWGFAVQFYEVDHLDDTLNVARLGNGNSIRMGVEFDKWFRPVAYHLLTEHPGDSFWSYNRRDYVRVPAEDIIHPFVRERINQPRGAPWMHSAMTRLNNIGAYEEAAIIAARIGASKMGFLQQDEMADTGSEGLAAGATGVDEKKRPISEVEPGLIEMLPKGYTFQAADWKYPDDQFADFMKASLRGISSGLLVSYNSLASDLEGVNYSSIRAGVLEERDCWKLQQAWWIENYKRPIYRRWLRWALLTGKLDLPLSKMDKFLNVQWQPRTWSWVDPEKDINAQVTAIENGLTSRTRVAAEAGMDFEELLVELQQEQELMAKYGIELKKKEEPAPGRPKKNGGEEDEDDEDEKKKPDANTRAIVGVLAALAGKDSTVNVDARTTVNAAPVQIDVQPAAPAQVSVPIENKIDVQPAAPAQVSIPFENKVEVQAPPAPTLTIENNMETPQVIVNTPDVKVENKVDVQPAAAPQVTVNTPEVKNTIRIPRAERKKRKMTAVRDADGTLRVTED